MCVCVRRQVSPPWRDLLFICGVRVGEGVGHILQLHIPSVGGWGSQAGVEGGTTVDPGEGGQQCGPLLEGRVLGHCPHGEGGQQSGPPL